MTLFLIFLGLIPFLAGIIGMYLFSVGYFKPLNSFVHVLVALQFPVFSIASLLILARIKAYNHELYNPEFSVPLLLAIIALMTPGTILIYKRQGLALWQAIALMSIFVTTSGLVFLVEWTVILKPFFESLSGY